VAAPRLQEDESMKNQGKLTVALVTSIAVAVAVAGGSIAADKPKIKQLMGDNFAGLQVILVALITSNYANVPSQAEVIGEHAMQLTKVIPDNAKDQSDQFLSYAYSLKAHADDLKAISELLMKHDRERASQAPLETDHLREALAAHYGGMVTMCVACHNRFRPQVVE
jgi:hypothetical protein